MLGRRKHWMRHTAMVPKGFIRYHVLESLSHKSMSGSEIMNEIEKRTDGHWKPSPGSVYPLLAWLQDNGYVKELPVDENGLKRYELTKKGKELLEEQRKIGVKFRKEMRFFAPPFIAPPFLGLWFRIPPEKTVEVRETMDKFMSAFFELGRCLEEKFSEQALEDARKVLEETAEKLEKINQNLRKEG